MPLCDAQLDAGDIDFDVYKHACELMELSCMKRLPEQDVQAGNVHLWQPTLQASCFLQLDGLAFLKFRLPLCHLCIAAVTGRTSEPRGKETDPQQDRVGFKHGRSRSFRSGGVLGLDAIEAYLDRVLAFNSLPSRSAPWPLCAAAAAAG